MRSRCVFVSHPGTWKEVNTAVLLGPCPAPCPTHSPQQVVTHCKLSEEGPCAAAHSMATDGWLVGWLR